MKTVSADALLEGALREANELLGNHYDGDVIFLKASMVQPVDDITRGAIEDLSEDENKKDKLVVVLETTGGFIEVVERIVGIFRKHYTHVEFFVPNYAYSAGTVLVMSGDEIHMDYHSILGPIDPQYESDNGEYVPGMGYLAKYEELMEDINNAKSTDNVRAQIAYLVQKFDPAKLYHIEQAIEHSKSLLKDWLPKYKFKDWNAKNTSGNPVTDADKQTRADEIAQILGDASRWHSHGRGITIKELQSEEIKLIINDFSDDIKGNEIIRNYYSLIVDYIAKLGMNAAIHTKFGIRRAK